MSTRIDFQTDPSKYKHWRVSYNGPVATLLMDVDEQGGLFDGYELKLNSYDLGVDIELADIVQRMRVAEKFLLFNRGWFCVSLYNNKSTQQ